MNFGAKLTVVEYFSVVSAICRVALSAPSEALTFQISRLAQCLDDDGHKAEAKSLKSLLLKSSRASEMAPRKLSPSKGSILPGEMLLPSTPLPADKETGIRLVETIFPEQLPDLLPIFPGELVRAISQIVEEWKHSNELLELGVQPTMSCLFVGQPGTGKTSLAYWLAKQLDLPVVLARIDAMMSSFLGTSARNITQVFAFANRFKCVLVLDEFDSLAKMRDDPNEVGEIKRVVNALLQNLDGRKTTGMTIGATNHPKLLDSAVWRRFSVQIQFPLPSYTARLDIASKYALPLSISESELKIISALLDGCSGAEIEEFMIAYKKRAAIPPAAASPLFALRDVATLNNGRISERMNIILFGPENDLVAWLRHNENFDLSIIETAKILGKAKSTVARKHK